MIKADGSVTTIESERPVTFYRTTMRYTLTNAKSTPVDVELTRAGSIGAGGATTTASPARMWSASRSTRAPRKWIVPVPANGERVVRVTYETRY